jgi:hypothetical protein
VITAAADPRVFVTVTTRGIERVRVSVNRDANSDDGFAFLGAMWPALTRLDTETRGGFREGRKAKR